MNQTTDERRQLIRQRQRDIVEKYGIITDPAEQPISERLAQASGVERRQNLTARELREEFRSTPVVCDAAYSCQYDAASVMQALKETYGHMKIRELGVTYGATLRIQQLGKFIPDDVKAFQQLVLDLSVREFLEEAESGFILYLSNLSIPQNFPLLSDLYHMPSIYGLNLRRPLSKRGSDQEIFIGPAGTGFGRLHQDTPGPAVWFLQLEGEKEFVLFPPTDRYALGAHRQAPRQSEMFSSFDPYSDRNSPCFDHADLHPYRAVLKAGQVMFLPPNWFHTARNLTLSVTIAERFWSTLNAHFILRYYLMRLFSRVFPFLRGYP